MVSNKIKLIIIGLVILMGIAGGVVGYNLPRQIVFIEHQVIVEKPVYIDRLREVEKPVYVDRVEIVEKPIIRIVEIEKIVEVEKEVIVYRDRTDWRFFESLPEFTTWLEGKLVYLMPPADCDDYAQRLQVLAYRDSYIISAQLVDKGKINGKIVSDNKKFHDGIRVNIGNKIYYVEPQPDLFRIIKISDRD